jgi:hypothetical protein
LIDNILSYIITYNNNILKMISSCVDPSCVYPSCVDPSCVDPSCVVPSCVVRSCVDLVENVFGFSDANLEADANALFKHNAKTTLKAEVYTIHAYKPVIQS